MAWWLRDAKGKREKQAKITQELKALQQKDFDQFCKEHLPQLKEIVNDLRREWLGRKLFGLLKAGKLRGHSQGVRLIAYGNTTSGEKITCTFTLEIQADKQFRTELTIDNSRIKMPFFYSSLILFEVKREIATAFVEGIFPEVR